MLSSRARLWELADDQARGGLLRMRAITSEGVRRSMGTRIAPAAQAPSMLSTRYGEFGASTITRSPGWTPSARSWSATALHAAPTSW